MYCDSHKRIHFYSWKADAMPFQTFLPCFAVLSPGREQQRVEPHFIFRTSTKLNCMKNSTKENRHGRRRFLLLPFLLQQRIFVVVPEKKYHTRSTYFAYTLYTITENRLRIGYTWRTCNVSRFVFSWVANVQAVL